MTDSTKLGKQGTHEGEVLLRALSGTFFPTNSDGAGPNGLTLAGDTLFGTANSGGSSGYGTVFKVNTDGTGFTNLHNFTGSDGANPVGGLLYSSGTLYGVNGTVYAINADGTGFRSLHNFTDANPTGLILSGNTLYGSTASYSGIAGVPTAGITFLATVFKVSTNGAGFTNLLSFTGYSPEFYFSFSGLTLSDNTLFGASSFLYFTCRQCPGDDYYGEVFAVNTDGTGYTGLHSFSSYNADSSLFLDAGLILSGNTLYGTTGGTIFSISFRPQLTTISSAGNFILTWPTNYAGFDYSGFTLQSTANLRL